MRRHIRWFAALWIPIPFQIAAAQSTTGTLVGTVTDPSGAAVAGVSVTATNTGTNQRRDIDTNDSGNYAITNLEAGEYRLEVRRTGFATIVQDGVQVRVNETSRLDMSLEVGQVAQTVDVGVSLLQTDTSSVGAVIDRTTIQGLPSNGRQFESLVHLMPGAATAAPSSHLSNRGGFNVSGLDEHYMSFFIDGIDNVDPVIRNFSYRPSIDLIQEFRVEQNGYAAEFGRNAGGVINVTTRSGTNRLHGSLWEFARNDNLDARNVFALPDAPKPSLIRHQFGAAVGGPLKRDRTFFFLSYEGLRQKEGMVRRATAPTERMRTGDLTELGGPVIPPGAIHPVAREVLDAYPLPNRPGISGNRIEVANRIDDANDFSARVDHEVLPGTRLMARFSRSVTRIFDPFRTETTGVSNLSGFGQTADRLRTNVGIALTTLWGDNVVNELRGGFNRFRQPQIPLNPGTPGQRPLMGFLKTFLRFNFLTADPIGSNAEFRRAVNVYNYIDNVTYVTGNHRIKAGVDARRYLFNAYNVGPNIFNFGGRRADPTSLPITDFLLGLPTQVISFDGSPGGNTRKFEFAAFVQDDWKVSPTFTVNYGMRWEYYGRITEKTNKQSFWEPGCNCIRVAGIDATEGLVDSDLNNYAPRLGFAWRPWGKTTVIRGAAGIYYDNDMRHNLEMVQNPPAFFTREFIYPFAEPTLSDPFPDAGSLSTRLPTTLDKKFRDTYVEHWSLGLQRELGRDMLVDVAYVGNHAVKARRLRNVNQPLDFAAPYPGFSTISLFEQAGSSNYHSLQVRATRRFSGGLGMTSAYTWGHAIDDRPGQGGGFPQNSYDLQAERGTADFDLRHRWVTSAIYALPFGEGRPWGGWTVHTIVTAQSGRPFTVTVGPPILGGRPNSVSGTDWRPENQGPDNWIDPGAFAAPPAGTFGNLGRNTLVGPGLFNVDASLVKRVGIREAVFQFRSEFFNIFNHPNFGLPNATFGSPALGVISATASPERQIQFGVRLEF